MKNYNYITKNIWWLIIAALVLVISVLNYYKTIIFLNHRIWNQPKHFNLSSDHYTALRHVSLKKLLDYQPFYYTSSVDQFPLRSQVIHMTLQGTAARQGYPDQGWALIKDPEGHSKLYQAGDIISDHIILKSVYHDYAIVSEYGSLKKIFLVPYQEHKSYQKG